LEKWLADRFTIFKADTISVIASRRHFVTPFNFGQSQEADCGTTANFLRRRCGCIFFHPDINAGARFQGKIRQKKDTIPTMICYFRPVKSTRIEKGTSHRCFIITSCAGFFSKLSSIISSPSISFLLDLSMQVGCQSTPQYRKCLFLLIFFDYCQRGFNRVALIPGYAG